MKNVPLSLSLYLASGNRNFAIAKITLYFLKSMLGVYCGSMVFFQFPQALQQWEEVLFLCPIIVESKRALAGNPEHLIGNLVFTGLGQIIQLQQLLRVPLEKALQCYCNYL